MLKQVATILPYVVFTGLGKFIAAMIAHTPHDEAHDQYVFTLTNIYCGFMLWAGWWGDLGGFNV